jgi:hypothetical protein
MMLNLESEEEIRREKKAIELFVSLFNGSFQKLDPNDIDYKIFDKDKKLIAYAEVRSRFKSIYDAYPLPISAKKMVKLMDKRLNPVVIWSCDDGIIYSKISHLTGTVQFESDDFVMYFDKQKSMKYVRFI